jgi:hypothetical protein
MCQSNTHDPLYTPPLTRYIRLRQPGCSRVKHLGDGPPGGVDPAWAARRGHGASSGASPGSWLTPLADDDGWTEADLRAGDAEPEPAARSISDATVRDAKHARVPLRRVRAGELRWEEILYELKAGPAGGRLRRPSSAGRPGPGRWVPTCVASRPWTPRTSFAVAMMRCPTSTAGIPRSRSSTPPGWRCSGSGCRPAGPSWISAVAVACRSPVTWPPAATRSPAST